MANYISARELRLIERQRMKDEEEDRKALKQMEREMKEKHKKAMSDFAREREQLRRDRLEKRKRLLEKQFELEKMKAGKLLEEEKAQVMKNGPDDLRNATFEITFDHDEFELRSNADANDDYRDKSFESMVYDEEHVQQQTRLTSTMYDEDPVHERLQLSDKEHERIVNQSDIERDDRLDLSDADSCEIDENDSSYTTIEDDVDTISSIGELEDKKKYIYRGEESLNTVEKEMKWLDLKSKECETETVKIEAGMRHSLSRKLQDRPSHRISDSRKNTQDRYRRITSEKDTDKDHSAIRSKSVRDIARQDKGEYQRRDMEYKTDNVFRDRDNRYSDRFTEIGRTGDNIENISRPSRDDKTLIQMKVEKNSQKYTGSKTKLHKREADEEAMLRDEIEKLMLENRKAENEIERKRKLREESARKETESKRLQELKIRKEMERKKEMLNRLKVEKEKLENELLKKEETLSLLNEGDKDIKERESGKVLDERESSKVLNEGDKDKVIDERNKVKCPEEKCEVKTEKKKTETVIDISKGSVLKPKVPNLTESTFEEWKLEVEVIMNSGLYQESILRQAVRNSLCGQTRRILLTMSPTTTTKEIIEKLESIYGNVRSGESVLAEFYMARQRKEENVAEWGIRLESIIQKAIEIGHVNESQKDEMLKTRFWRQLYNVELKNATRMSFETSLTFEELRRKVRTEENEIRSARLELPYIVEEKASVQQQIESTKQEDILQDIVDRMNKLETEVSKPKEREYENRYRNRDDGTWYRESDRDTRYRNGSRSYRNDDRRYRDDDRRDTRFRKDETRYGMTYTNYRGNGQRSDGSRDYRPRIYDDRRDYRDRRRYSPTDRRNTGRDNDYRDQKRGNDRDHRFDNNNSDSRNDRRQDWRYTNRDYGYRDPERAYEGYYRSDNYRRDNRGDRKSEVDRNYNQGRNERDNRSNPEQNGSTQSISNENERIVDKTQNRAGEHTDKKTADNTANKTDLNSKASLSGGR